MEYNRYGTLIVNGMCPVMPLIQLSEKSTDYFEEYIKGVTRMDILSYNYYNNPNFGWLIMLANQEYGSMEFEIPDRVMLRIPYPLEASLQDYENKISEYKSLYNFA